MWLKSARTSFILIPASLNFIIKRTVFFCFDIYHLVNVVFVSASCAYAHNEFKRVEIIVNNVNHYVHFFIDVGVHYLVLSFGENVANSSSVPEK